jgi:RNA polymerase sigma-70 factor (ECF subfamily)
LEAEVALEHTSERKMANSGHLVEKHHAAMLRVASFRGAKRRDIDRAIVDAARFAAASPVNDRESVLFLALLERVAALERETPRPEDWEANPEPALEAKNVESGDSRWAGWFKVDPVSFRVLGMGNVSEARSVAADALSRLPLAQRAVVVLRDVAGWTGDETSRALRLEPEIERRLLHAGRTRIRRALEHLAAKKSSSRG